MNQLVLEHNRLVLLLTRLKRFSISFSNLVVEPLRFSISFSSLVVEASSLRVVARRSSIACSSLRMLAVKAAPDASNRAFKSSRPMAVVLADML